MQNIRGKDTSIERLLAKDLYQRGIRYRKNVRSLYGTPDLAIKKYKLAIFVDGDFWHGYDWERRKEDIRTNRAYWIPKIERNMNRDIEVSQVLRKLGYTVIRIWEHDLKTNLKGAGDLIENILREKILSSHFLQ